jgi:hypothetical protein
MNEATWHSSSDPGRMLTHLSGKASVRKLRLFAAACCRRVSYFLTERSNRSVVETAERFADGEASQADLTRAYAQAGYLGLAWAVADSAFQGADLWASCGGMTSAERAERVALLRCLFGNPFRPLPARAFPAEMRGLAEACYATFPKQAPELGLLADALADLGEEEASAHLRQREHVKGCHVLDWVTGRG